MNNTAKKLLIIGDTGFVGKYLKKVIETNSPSTTISGFNRSSGYDIRNYENVSRMVTDNDLVINLAGTSDIQKSWKNIKETISIDAYGAVNVFKACASAKVPLIHISSSEVYGQNLHPGHPISENHPMHPRHPYGIAKKAADMAAQNYIDKGNYIVILRPFTLYGEGTEEPLEKFIPHLTRNAILGKDIPVEGNGDIKRDWVFVGDLAEAIWLAQNAIPGIYNIATGVPHSLNQVATIILHETKKILPTKSRIIQLSYKKNINEAAELIGDPTKFYTATGWRNSITLAEGVKKYINYYLAKV